MMTASQARKNADSGRVSIVRGRVAVFAKAIGSMIERASHRGDSSVRYEIHGPHSFAVAIKIRDKFLNLGYQVTHRSGTNYEELSIKW